MQAQYCEVIGLPKGGDSINTSGRFLKSTIDQIQQNNVRHLKDN